jgi:hypothetical protein
MTRETTLEKASLPTSGLLDSRRDKFVLEPTFRLALPAQTVDATLVCSLLAGVAKPRVFLGRWFRRNATWSSCA